MNRGILAKTLRESVPATLAIGFVLLLVESLLTFVLPSLHQQFAAQILQVAWIRRFIESMLGMDAMGPEAFEALAWVHPIVLLLVCTHAIVQGTRVPVGEVDRGTIDLLLSLPVSRRSVHVTEIVVALGGGAILAAFMVLGNVIGSDAAAGDAGSEGASLARRALVAGNLWALHATITAVASLASAYSDRRGRAIAFALAFTAAAFLWTFLRRFWYPAEHAAFLSPFTYYQPASALGGNAPWLDIAVLAGCTAGIWAWSGVVFVRRDLVST